MDNYARRLLEQRLERVNLELEKEEKNNLSLKKQLIQSDNQLGTLHEEQADLINSIARLPD